MADLKTLVNFIPKNQPLYTYVIFTTIKNVLFNIVYCRYSKCFVCSIFLVLSRESDGGAIIFWTNPHSLRSCPFPIVSNFFPVNLLLV